jgi:hypothetical protein
MVSGNSAMTSSTVANRTGQIEKLDNADQGQNRFSQQRHPGGKRFFLNHAIPRKSSARTLHKKKPKNKLPPPTIADADDFTIPAKLVT